MVTKKKVVKNIPKSKAKKPVKKPAKRPVKKVKKKDIFVPPEIDFSTTAGLHLLRTAVTMDRVDPFGHPETETALFGSVSSLRKEELRVSREETMHFFAFMRRNDEKTVEVVPCRNDEGAKVDNSLGDLVIFLEGVTRYLWRKTNNAVYLHSVAADPVPFFHEVLERLEKVLMADPAIEFKAEKVPHTRPVKTYIRRSEKKGE